MSAPAIGVRIPQYGSDWPGVRDFALRAERLGFESLWVNDHLQSPGRLKSEPAFDALTTMAALAALTRRPRLGVAVLSASYRPAPLAAKMATLLDVISEGRLIVGLGTGSDVDEHRAYGVPFGSPAERAEGLRAALEVMRAMFEHPDGADVEGLLEGAPNRPAPVQPGGPPILLAAHRPRLLRLAGERADGIVAAFVGADVVAGRLSVADAARLAAGRPPLRVRALHLRPAGPEPPRGRGLAAPGGRGARLHAGAPAALARRDRDRGAPGEIAGELARLGEAGVTDAALVLPSRVPADALDALAEAALPAPAPASAPAPPRRGRPGDNLVDLLVERHAAGSLADAPAAVDESGGWTFAELSDAAARAGGALGDAGARRGDRVAIALRDGRAWLAAFLGAARIGAVAVPLDPNAAPERLADLLDDCEPAVLAAEAGAPAAPPGIALLDPAALGAGRPAPVAAVHPEDLAYLIYSSGSTGRPKGAMHAHQDLRVGIESYAREVLALEPGDRCHSTARLFTSLGFGNGFFRVLGRGATAVLSGVLPTPRAVIATVAREGVSVLTGVPTFWAQLARFLERHPEPDALASVRLAVSSGDSLPPSVAARLREVAGVELIEGLGCSECSNIVISTRPGEPLPGTLGRAVSGAEIRLADDQGRPVEPGTPGRLWIRSDSNTTGYWRRVAETREVVVGHWLRMGDVLVAEDGVYRHLGRADDLFKVDARWVSPTEVEAALLTHAAVGEAAVVGRPDADGLPRPAAYIVLADGAEAGDGLAADLRRHVARALAPHAAPQTVTVLDALPRLASGKLDRRRLRG